MATGIIYYIKNLANGWMYVGSTLYEKERLSKHLRHLRKNKHVNQRMQDDFNEYGEENFAIEIACRDVSEETLGLFEKSEIQYLREDTAGKLYNISSSSRISSRVRKQARSKRNEGLQLLYERNNTWSPTPSSQAKTKNGRLPLSSSLDFIEPTTSLLTPVLVIPIKS